MIKNLNKIAKTEYPIMDIIKERYSTYTFSNKPVADSLINQIIEAGSWSFSSNNIQPWKLIIAKKGTPEYLAIFDSLSIGNKNWAHLAPIFIVTLCIKTIDNSDKINKYAEHDTGAFTAFMILEAVKNGLVAHPLGGFDQTQIVEYFSLPENIHPLTVISIGYLGETDVLTEPYLNREKTQRTRKNIKSIII